jgi:hypothetical protein
MKYFCTSIYSICVLTVLLSLDHRLDELPVATFFLLLLFLEREGKREREIQVTRNSVMKK